MTVADDVQKKLRGLAVKSLDIGGRFDDTGTLDYVKLALVEAGWLCNHCGALMIVSTTDSQHADQKIYRCSGLVRQARL
jgi:hypothetical protein